MSEKSAERHEELSALRDAARGVLEKESSSARVRAAIDSVEGFDTGLWKTMSTLGWTGVLVPEGLGGSGGTFADLAVIAGELGRHVTPGPFLATGVLATSALLLAGDDEQRARWLPSLSGGTVATFASFGAGGHNGRDGLGVEAVADGKGVVLDGTAEFVPDAEAAELFVVAARHGDGVVLAVVDAGASGLRTEDTPAVDLTRRLGRVILDGVPVEAAAVLGARDGSETLDAIERRAAAVLAADSAGGAERVLEMTTEYARARHQFGRPIGSFQAVKHMCADMLVLVEASKVAVEHAASAVDDALAVAVAKSYAGDAYAKVAGDGVQLHGGIGFTWEHDAHLHLKRAKLNQVWFGDGAWHRARLAGELIPR